jgi:membrane protein
MNLKAIPSLIHETYLSWSNDKAERLAAALAYYTLFSIAPLVVVAVAIAGLVFGEEAARGQISGQFRDMLGPQAADAIQSMIAHAYRPSAGIVATAIGIGTLLVGAAGVFTQIQDAFNTIWRVEPKKHSGFWAAIRSRFLSFTMVFGVGFVLLVSLVLSALLAGVSKYLGDMLPGSGFLWSLLEVASSFLVISLLFAMLFKVLPDTDVQWRDVWVGALSTSALFTLGKFLIGLYLGRSSIASAYGAAGSLVVLLLWVYYAAQILYFGAELTRVYAEKFGSRVNATDRASADGTAPGSPGSPARVLAPVTRIALAGEPHQEAVPYSVLRESEASGYGKEIRTAGLIGAALGLVIGLLRPSKAARTGQRR